MLVLVKRHRFNRTFLRLIIRYFCIEEFLYLLFTFSYSVFGSGLSILGLASRGFSGVLGELFPDLEGRGEGGGGPYDAQISSIHCAVHVSNRRGEEKGEKIEEQIGEEPMLASLFCNCLDRV